MESEEKPPLGDHARRLAPEQEMLLATKKIVERHKTWRLLIVCGSLVLGMSSVAWALAWAIRGSGKDFPWATFLGILLGPSSIAAVLISARAKSIENKAKPKTPIRGKKP